MDLIGVKAPHLQPFRAFFQSTGGLVDLPGPPMKLRGASPQFLGICREPEARAGIAQNRRSPPTLRAYPARDLPRSLVCDPGKFATCQCRFSAVRQQGRNRALLSFKSCAKMLFKQFVEAVKPRLLSAVLVLQHRGGFFLFSHSALASFPRSPSRLRASSISASAWTLTRKRFPLKNPGHSPRATNCLRKCSEISPLDATCRTVLNSGIYSPPIADDYH